MSFIRCWKVRKNLDAPGLSAELHRQVIAQLAPHGIRRASAVATQQTEPVPVWTAPKKRTARIPTHVLLLIGFTFGLILIFLGIQLVHWVNEVSAHWHGGDGLACCVSF